MTGQHVAIACDLAAIETAAREQHERLSVSVLQAVLEVREDAAGFAFRLPVESDMLIKAARFVANERLCCPFFHFTIEVEPRQQGIWLRLSGSDDVRAFIRASFIPEVPSRERDVATDVE